MPVDSTASGNCLSSDFPVPANSPQSVVLGIDEILLSNTGDSHPSSNDSSGSDISSLSPPFEDALSELPPPTVIEHEFPTLIALDEPGVYQDPTLGLVTLQPRSEPPSKSITAPPVNFKTASHHSRLLSCILRHQS